MEHDQSKGGRRKRLVASLVIVGSVSIATGCQGTLRSASDALAQGNFERAEKSARQGLAKGEDDPEYHLVLAKALVGQKRWEDAEPHAERAYKSGEFPAAAGRTYGKVLWELDRPVEAVEAWRSAREADAASVGDDDYRRALERAIDTAHKRNEHETVLALRQELKSFEPDHAGASQNAMIASKEAWAETLEREGNYERAIEIYGELEAERPEHAAYPWARGRLLATLGRDDEAATAFDKYVDIGKKSTRIRRYQEVAVEAEQLGSYKVAGRFYERAIEELGDKPSRRRAEFHKRLAGLLLSAGASDEGRKHLRAYVDDEVALGPKPVSAQIYLRAADVATQYRHPNLALELLEEAIADAAPSWGATRRLAELYARRAKNADVERVVKQYIERSDSKTTARVRVGRWAAARRNFELARFFLEAAVQDSNVPAAVWLELARVYSALGFGDEVRRSLETYAKKAPERRRALLDVATIYKAQRMYDEAEKALLEAMAASKDDFLIVKQLEELYREWGRPKKIHEIYAKWAKGRGNKPEDMQAIGERFFRQQEFDDALPYLEKAAKGGQTDAWLQVADIYNRQRKERDMKDALDKYLAQSKDRARALNAVLQRYRVSNWNYEAIPILEELVKLEPRNVLHYEQLSQLYFEQGRDVEAFELWKRYIEMSSNPIASLETMARRFQRRNHQDWMLQFLHQVLEKEEKPDPRIYRLLGDTYADTYYGTTGQFGQARIFTQENKAKEYYARYLEEASPTRGELQSFAESMRQKQFWEIAAKAYEKLKATGGKLQSHQLLNYGIVLLNLGRADEAEVIFADYYDDRQKSVDAALAISDQLYNARRYGAVEPYLRAMLEKGDEGLVRQAFMRLAEVYWRSDRSKEIKPLIAEFLDRTQNPTEARRHVQMMLEAAGMWGAAAEQLEAMRDVQGDDIGFALGLNLFRAGERDRADDAFRDFASNNLNPTDAWRMVGEFWEARGEPDRARNAYQNAANSAPQNESVQAALGRFQILVGQVKEGRASFERARSNLPHGQRGGLYRMEVEALVEAGRFGDARQVARDAVAVAYLDRDFFYEVFARTELHSGDPVRSQRMVDELESANLPLDVVVRLLRDAGYLEKAAELIDKEITNGDYIVGGDVLLNYPRVFTRVGGIDRFMRSAQPLLERAGRDPQTARRIGLFLVAEGHLEQGAMLLRQAVELGDAQLRPELAGVYATLGHHEEAFEILQAELASADPARRTMAIHALGARYEIIGERARFKTLLEHLARDSRFAAEAIGPLVSYLVADGEVALVVDSVRRLVAPDQNGERGVSIGEDRRAEVAVAALVAGVEELAIAGFEQEAVNLLSEAPPTLQENEQVRDLRLRVAAFGGVLDAEHEFNSALIGLGKASNEAWQRLQIAELAVVAGRTELASQIAAETLASPDFDISSRSLRILMRAARIAGDLDKIDELIARFTQHNVDRVGARQILVSELSQLGLDERALKLANEQAARVPIDSHVSNALLAAQRAGEPKALAKWTDRLVEVHRLDPIAELENHYYVWSLRQEDSLNEPVRAAIAPMFEQGLAGIEVEIQNLYRKGEPFAARERVTSYLTKVDFDPQAVEEMFRTLEQMRLRGDIARFLGPLVPQDRMTLDSRRILGLANLTVGFNDDGFKILDQMIEASPDPAHEAAAIADELVARDLYRPALRYAEDAVARRPTRPEGLLMRGLARLGIGDVEGAREDLDATLDAGLDRNETLRRAGVVALRSGNKAFAREHLGELFTAFDYAFGSPTLSAIAAFEEGGDAAGGVEFMESFRPEIVQGRGLAGRVLVSPLSAMYEAAHKPERAFQVYEDAIRRYSFTSPFDPQLATFRNNLAYTFSTTDQNVDAGEQLVLEAIAEAGRREANYIDTLGWIYFRQGELDRAEAEIRRAIRSSGGALTDLGELYRHLAEIRAAKGYHGEAVWLEIFAESMERR